MSATVLDAAAPAAPDPDRLNAPVGRMLGDLGAAYILPLVRIGDELGLHAALAEAGFSRVRVAAETPFNMVIEARG